MNPALAAVVYFNPKVWSTYPENRQKPAIAPPPTLGQKLWRCPRSMRARFQKSKARATNAKEKRRVRKSSVEISASACLTNTKVAPQIKATATKAKSTRQLERIGGAVTKS